jgi:hypothetical protein
VSRVAYGLIGLSVLIVLAVGSFGPTAAQAKLPGGPAWLPPYSFGIDPGPMSVTVLLMAGIIIGMVGLLFGLQALERGWRPDTRRLTRVGAALTVLMVLVGPMGSTDVLIYAGYGRLAATGRSPYVHTVRELMNAGDPVGLANTGIRWVDTTSVYGPVSTWLQTLAAWIGHGSVQVTVFVMTATCAVAYLITGVLLRRLAGGDELRQARVALLWTVNPVLLFIAVNSGHADTWGIVFAVASLWALSRRHWMLAGVLVALACAVKITFGIYVLALVIVLRRLPRKLAVVIVAGLITGGICYLTVGTSAIGSTLHAGTKYASASPWRWPLYPLSELIGLSPGVRIIVIVGWLSMFGFGWLFYRLMTRAARNPAAAVVEETGDPLRAMLPVVTALGIGWVLTSAYALPWYDVIAWAPLALLLPASGRPGADRLDPGGVRLVDRVLLVRTAALVVAYLPGAAYYFPPASQLLTDVARNVMGPAVSWALMIIVVIAALRPNLLSKLDVL